MRRKSSTLNGAGGAENTASQVRLRRRSAPLRRTRGAATPQYLPVSQLADTIEWHLTDFDSKGYSSRTTEKKRGYLSMFLRWAEQTSSVVCDPTTLKAFFAFLNRGHEQPGGLWGNDRSKKPLRPSTKETYYRVLSAFFNWLLREKKITEFPLETVDKPKVPHDQIVPMTQDDIDALIRAAKRSRDTKRNVAIVKLMFDTGLRASEVCQLRLGDIDFKQNSLRVVGKGDKVRLVYMDPEVGRELTQYLQDFGSIADFEENEPLFVSQRGTEAGQMLDRNGLGKLIKRLGRSAKLKNVRISPHTLRHTYAVESLRNGCNNFALQQSLGHSSLAMTRRYVSLVDADLQNQHRTSSPLSALRRRKGK